MDTKVFVKSSLKSQILRRRQQYGLGHIEVDFSPKPSQPLTPEEIEKEERRKESNRQSAMRSRQKMKKDDELNRKILKKETERKNELIKRIKTLTDHKRIQVVQLKTLGIPEQTIQTVLLSAHSEWQKAIEQQSDKRANLDVQPQARDFETSNAAPSKYVYSGESDSYTTSTDSSESSVASSPSRAYASSSNGFTPAYSFQQRTIPAIFSSEERCIVTQGTPPDAAEDELMQMNMDTLSSLLQEAESVDEDESSMLADIGDSLYGGNTGEFNCQENSIAGFPIRQALMCI